MARERRQKSRSKKITALRRLGGTLGERESRPKKSGGMVRSYNRNGITNHLQGRVRQSHRYNRYKLNRI